MRELKELLFNQFPKSRHPYMCGDSIVYLPHSIEIYKGLKVIGHDIDGFPYLENGLCLDLVEAHSGSLPEASLVPHGLFIPIVKFGFGLNEDYRSYTLYYFNRFLRYMQQLNTPIHPEGLFFLFLCL
jgi:hypothetical protein